MLQSLRKHIGAYYTPPAVAASLVSWAIRSPDDLLLDPSCGDGEFVALHSRSWGIDQDPEAAAVARMRAPEAEIVSRDFFAWATDTEKRFDCVTGNPPFIRYQTFKGEARKRALTLCSLLGAGFSGLSSSWAPFLVVAASLVRPGGRMAFVVPAEIGHAPYAAPLLEFIVSRFERVHIVAVRTKLFPELSEDCWLLYADGAGGNAKHLAFSAVERFEPTTAPPAPDCLITVAEWRDSWRRRLRPLLIPQATRELYQAARSAPHCVRLKDIATVRIGYVTGDNNFFHLRPSTARKWGIPRKFLQRTVRGGGDLHGPSLTSAVIEAWMHEDRPVLLLRLTKDSALPASVQHYLDSPSGVTARSAYKCRMRAPWWSVPDVRVPDFFLTYMSGKTPKLVRNAAGCTCTNSLHAVRIDKIGVDPDWIRRGFESSLGRLSCEIEGHALGGGMLKLEPREAGEIMLSTSLPQSGATSGQIEEAIEIFQAWRHVPGGSRQEAGNLSAKQCAA